MEYELKTQLELKDNLLRLKEEQLRMLEDSIKWKDEKINTLENSLRFREGKSNKDRILNLLQSEALTSNEIADKLDLSEQDARTYLLRLKKKKKIKVIEKKGRYNIYTLKSPKDFGTPEDLLTIKKKTDGTTDNKRDIAYGTEILREFFEYEKRLREETDERISKLEEKIENITSQKLEKDSTTKLEKIIVFQYNDELSEFQELEIEGDIRIADLLDPDLILLFIVPNRYRVWLWHGSNTTTRMKFISAKLAPSIRDKYGIGFKISAVDEANETFGFKLMAGIEKDIEFSEVYKERAYKEEEEEDLLDSLSREKILLLLEKTGLPKGYERKMVIVNNKIYAYKELDRNYLGTVVREKRLFPLREKIEDGTYLIDRHVPRMLFSFNNLVLTELLQEIDTYK